MVSQPLLAVALLIGLFLGGPAARAEDGVSADALLIGMVNAQSGPAAGLGLGMAAGAQAYFARINAAGGVNGRKISLIVRDDAYEPARSAALTEALINTTKVFALLGYVGTPTSRAALPLAREAQVPFLFPFTGAEFLRTPVKLWAFNVRASYFDETEALIEHIHHDLGSQKIALLMQDDSFGEAVKGGIAGALSKRGMGIHSEARILRNSLDVAGAVHSLKLAAPDAIVFVGTYQQLAAAIKLAKANGLTARFFTVSFIGTENFIASAGADGEGVYISQVMPSPHDPSLPIIREYLADIAPADVGYASLEGYIGARVFVEALQTTGAQPTRAELVDALQYLSIDLGGFQVKFSPDNHQGSRAVFLTRIQAGVAVPVKHMQ
ncbi:MAG: ABC transporter substrate-binding protein [Pseudomonadaceae bacterium]|nr:ABC transporter substrate-binding protein [Pseudomonadaceae bacterium]